MQCWFAAHWALRHIEKPGRDSQVFYPLQLNALTSACQSWEFADMKLWLSPENELWPVSRHSDNLILFLFTLTTKIMAVDKHQRGVSGSLSPSTLAANGIIYKPASEKHLGQKASGKAMTVVCTRPGRQNQVSLHKVKHSKVKKITTDWNKN